MRSATSVPIGRSRLAWLLAAALSVLLGYGGARLAIMQSRQSSSVGSVVGSIEAMSRHELQLTAEQRTAFDRIDRRYHQQVAPLETQLNQEDRDFYATLREEGYMGPRSEALRQEMWNSFKALQDLTFNYVLDVHTLLSPAQREQLDQRVLESLAVR